MTDNNNSVGTPKKQYGPTFRIVSAILGAFVWLGAIVTAILSIIYGGIKYWYLWIPVLPGIFIGSALFQAGLQGHDPLWLFDMVDGDEKENNTKDKTEIKT